MALEIEINFYPEDFERVLQWYSLAFKDAMQTNEDTRIYNKISVLAKSLKEDKDEDQFQNRTQ